MKKILCVLLSLVMLFGATCGVDFFAYASDTDTHLLRHEQSMIVDITSDESMRIKYIPDEDGMYEFTVENLTPSDKHSSLEGWFSGVKINIGTENHQNDIIEETVVIDERPKENNKIAAGLSAFKTYYLTLYTSTSDAFTARVSVKKGHECSMYAVEYKAYSDGVDNIDGKKTEICPACKKCVTLETYYAVESINLSQSRFVYDGKVHKPEVLSVEDRMGNVISPDNYTVSYSNSSSVDVNAYYIHINFKGDIYTGHTDAVYFIRPDIVKSISTSSKSNSIKLSWEKPKGTVEFYEIMYSTEKDFSSYGVNTNTVSVNGNEKTITKLKPDTKYYVKMRAVSLWKEEDSFIYSLWSDVKTITTKPTSTTITSIGAQSKGFTLKWKKQSGIDGYQIKYSTGKSFKNAKYITVKGAKSTSKTVKKLKANKKYYVCVRTYKTVNGKKRYSDWSAAKSVKTK